MEDLDEFEATMHETLDELELDREVVDAMRSLWVSQINLARQQRKMH